MGLSVHSCNTEQASESVLAKRFGVSTWIVTECTYGKDYENVGLN